MRRLQFAQLKLSIKYQWCSGSLQGCHQKKIRFDFKLLVTGSLEFKTVNTSGDNLRILLTGLTPDTRYNFNVFAVNKQGAGALSQATVATLSSSQVPGRPLNLVAEAETDSSIRVTWAAPDTGYAVFSILLTFVPFLSE